MSTNYYGTPYEIENLPTPAATVNISSSTNGANTVITTSTAHGLQTGQAVIINGHLLNTNANGIWIATVVDADEFKISTFAGFPGTFVTGNAAGGASGTVQSLALPGLALPEDLVDNIDASSVNVPLEGLTDMVAWLAYRQMANLVILKGGFFTVQTDVTITTASGSQANFNGGATFLGTTTMSSTTNLNGTTAVNGIMTFNQPRRYRDPSRPADAATINVSVNDADVIILPNPASDRIVVVADASEGDQLELVMPLGLTAGKYFTVKRADATVIAEMWASDVNDGGGEVTQSATVTLQVEAGVWRGLTYSGYIVAGAGW